MKNNLSHLPECKQRELQQIVEITCQQVETEMIILFGSYARGDWVEERASDGHHWQYQSDYDILVLVENKKLAKRDSVWHNLWKATREAINTPLSIIAHTVNHFNRKVDGAEYFFTDILQEGILLYDSKRFQLHAPKPLNLTERKQKAVEDFEYWFTKSQGFLKHYHFGFSQKDYNLSAFMLHQATEHCYATVLLVFTNYKPRTHDIKELGTLVAAQAPEFLAVFPQGTEEERSLFELLRSAYVGARYKKEYSITREELDWLSNRVSILHDLTESLCQKKIASFI